jgi:hypothetical protein
MPHTQKLEPETNRNGVHVDPTDESNGTGAVVAKRVDGYDHGGRDSEAREDRHAGNGNSYVGDIDTERGDLKLESTSLADYNYIFKALADVTLSKSGLQEIFSPLNTAGDGLSGWLVISWELPGLLAKRSASKELSTMADGVVQTQNVWDMVVICGSAGVYEASTAGQYLTKHFPALATAIMEIIQDALDHISQMRGKSTMEMKCSRTGSNNTKNVKRMVLVRASDGLLLTHRVLFWSFQTLGT